MLSKKTLRSLFVPSPEFIPPPIYSSPEMANVIIYFYGAPFAPSVVAAAAADAEDPTPEELASRGTLISLNTLQ